MVAISAENITRRLTGRLKMRHMALLLEIERRGSLTRVAQHMATSQPAVTSALQELEDMFGTPLFERSARGMKATAQGQVVLARARAMLQDLDQMAMDMEAVARGRDAHLHVGAVPFTSGRLLSAAIRRTLPGEQRLMVTIHHGTTGQLLGSLRDHELDIVIGRPTADMDLDGLTHEVLFHQSPRLIANRALAARLGSRRLDWARLLDLDWILGPRGTSLRAQVADIFIQAGLMPPTPQVESYSSKIIGEMIASSERAISIVPADLAEEMVHVAGVAIVPYSFDWTLSPVLMLARAQPSARPVDALFMAALRDICAQTPAVVARSPGYLY